MGDIKEILDSLRFEINLYRNERGNRYILDDILAVEIAVNMTEFALKKNIAIQPENEIWFGASFNLAHAFDGTERERIYILYKKLVNYVEAYAYFRREFPKVDW